MILDMTASFVESGLDQKWSPEKIASVGRIIGRKVSHEWVCGYVQRYKLTGGKLDKQLRQSRRKYCKGSCAKCVIIPNRFVIECRLAIVNKKKWFGDWEADTVLGKQEIGAIASLVERKSKLYLIRKVPAKSAADVAKAIVGILWKY